MLQDYFDRHYITRIELLARLEIATQELDDALTVGMLPACSYRVQSGTASTVIFGGHPAPDCREGEYFAPSVTAWYRKSRRLLGDTNAQDQPVSERLRQDFVAGYIESASTNALFRASYAALLAEPQALERMANDTWGHHCRGTYGVCVIAPDSFERIQFKQAAVKRLAEFTNDGVRSTYSAEEKAELLRLIKSYNDVTMPFSPADYPKSSRKRLVDDVMQSL